MRGRAPQPHGGTSCPAALTLAQTFNSANLSLELLRHVVVKRKKNVFFPPSPKDMTSDFLARSQTDFRWWRHLRRPAALAVFTAHSLICPKATNSGFLPPSFCCELAAHLCFLLQEIKNERSTLRTRRKEWTEELEALRLIAFAFQERKNKCAGWTHERTRPGTVFRNKWHVFKSKCEQTTTVTLNAIITVQLFHTLRINVGKSHIPNTVTFVTLFVLWSIIMFFFFLSSFLIFSLFFNKGDRPHAILQSTLVHFTFSWKFKHCLAGRAWCGFIYVNLIQTRHVTDGK